LIMLKVDAQQYIVLRVVPPGQVLYAKNQKKVQHGDKLDGSKLVSLQAGQKIFVISAKTGLEMWSGSPSNIKTDKSGEQNTLATLFHFSSNSHSLMGRGAKVETIPAALQTADTSNGKVIIEKENKFLFDTNQFPQNSNTAFFIEIDVKEHEPIKRLLKTSQDTVFINYSDLETGSVDSGATYQIGFYYRNDVNKTKLITSFEPYFDLNNETERIISSSIMVYKGQKLSKDALKGIVYSILSDMSGKPNGISFGRLFDKYYQNE
jgi:hypothetical protein